jgi:hypothetical protein
MNLRALLILGIVLLVGTGCPHDWMKGGTNDRAMRKDMKALIPEQSQEEEEEEPCPEDKVATWTCEPLPCRWICE